MSRTSYSFCLWERNGRASEADPTTLFHSIFGGKMSVSSVQSEADRMPDGKEKRLVKFLKDWNLGFCGVIDLDSFHRSTRALDRPICWTFKSEWGLLGQENCVRITFLQWALKQFKLTEIQLPIYLHHADSSWSLGCGCGFLTGFPAIVALEQS